MTKCLPALAALLSVSVFTPARPLEMPGPQQASRTRDIYVSVLDDKGQPVPGLTTADFVVREDGTLREVLKAGPATAPLQVALLVDDSQASTPLIQPLREGPSTRRARNS
jgi:hypothetical protein